MIHDAHARVRPSAGDFVVLYEPRTLSRNPRLVLARWQDDTSPTLIRATFESAEVAGTRFEDQARTMAAESGTRSFRGVNMEYTPLDVPTDADGA